MMETQLKKSRWKTLLPAAVALALVVALAPSGELPATADTYGSCDISSGCLPDGSIHDYCFNLSYISSLSTPVTNAMANLDSQTDMSDNYISLCTANTDIVISWVGNATLGSSTLGDYTCLTKQPTGRCNQARVRLNSDLLSTASNKQKTACHEIGHSTGMAHGPSYGGCMVSGYSNTIVYSAHHIAHVNSVF